MTLARWKFSPFYGDLQHLRYQFTSTEQHVIPSAREESGWNRPFAPLRVTYYSSLNCFGAGNRKQGIGNGLFEGALSSAQCSLSRGGAFGLVRIPQPGFLVVDEVSRG